MRYLVDVHPSIAAANRIDSGEGPGPIFAYIAERFKPEAMFGTPTQRRVFIVVDLPTDKDAAELMYILTWLNESEPTFTPIMDPMTYMGAIEAARRAPRI